MTATPAAREADDADGGPAAARSGVAGLIVMLAATTILSQFFRTSLAVIAPELIRDLALTPRMLGLANGAFFLALLVAQVYVGVCFDRVGVARTVSALSVLMVVGAGLHAMAATGEMLVAARLVVGLGSAASFMATLVLVSQWFPRAQWSTRLSWVFGLSQLGILGAGTPLAVVAEAYGWRTAFAIAGVLAGITGVVFHVIVRDRPGAAVVPAAAPAATPGALEGLRLVLALPGILPVFAMFAVAYAATVTVSSLWAGPYLNDIHGLDTVSRGHVVTAMAVIQAIFVLAYGPLDRVFNTRKWIVVFGATLTCCALAALAVLQAPPLWLALALMFAMVALTSYNPILLAHMRSHIPDHLAGRGATTGNMCQLVGAGLLPVATGFIPGMFAATGPGYAPDAYRLIFATLALALAAGIAVYLTSRDVHPRG